MGRLCGGIKVSGGNIERLALAREKAQQWQVNLVLKGSCTIVSNPQAQTRINWWGNPVLATAGTGDVLAGMISGFLAQDMQPFDAASAAVRHDVFSIPARLSLGRDSRARPINHVDGNLRLDLRRNPHRNREIP